jgi:hypothetical protein
MLWRGEKSEAILTHNNDQKGEHLVLHGSRKIIVEYIYGDTSGMHRLLNSRPAALT